MLLEQLHVFYQGNQGMQLDRLVQFVSDQRYTCRAMYSFILIFLACMIFRPKNSCVSANMPKKIRVGRSENLFIFQ